MNYAEVLGRALRISWRYRYLWLLALFGGDYSSGSNLGYSGNTSNPSSRSSSSSTSGLQPYLDWLNGHLGLLMAIGIAFLVLWLIWFLVGCLASGGLVRAVAELDAGHPFRGGQAWAAGARTFWPVLALRLLYLLVSLAVAALLIGLPILLAISHPPASLVFLILLVPFGLLFFAYAVLADVVFKLALRCLVLELLGPIAAIGSGLRLLGRRFGRVALFWLILIAVAFGVGIGLGVPLAIIGVVFAGPISEGVAGGDVNLVVSTLAAAGAVGLLVYMVLAALLGTYWSAVWTLGYRRFEVLPGAPPPPSLPGW